LNDRKNFINSRPSKQTYYFFIPLTTEARQLSYLITPPHTFSIPYCLNHLTMLLIFCGLSNCGENISNVSSTHRSRNNGAGKLAGSVPAISQTGKNLLSLLKPILLKNLDHFISQSIFLS